MDEIRQCTEALKKAVRESDDYKGFAKAKAALEANPELREMVMTFRRRNYEIQNLKEGTDVYTEMEQLEEEYHEIRKNPLISDYLQYELGLCRIMQRINLSLVGTVDLDIGDFKDIIKW